MKVAEEPQILELSNKDLEQGYKQARKKLQESKVLAAAWREEHVAKLDEARVAEKGVPVEKISQERRRVEQQRRLGANLAHIKGSRRDPVTTVFKRDATGNRISCTSQQEIETACLEENEKRFSQTEGTPAMNPALCGVVSFCAELPAAQLILNGAYDGPGCEDVFMRKVIQGLQMPLVVLQEGWISSEISVTEHSAAWRRQKERTASERSLLGFSDHKAAIFHPEMCEMDRLFRQILYCNGFAPQLHLQVTDFQILKQPGNYEVESMRTIQLMPAAFNINNKKTRRMMMHRAEHLKLLPQEQAGSRKGRRAVESALEKVLFWDCMRHRRWHSAMISNDAKSCYDRIVLWSQPLLYNALAFTRRPPRRCSGPFKGQNIGYPHSMGTRKGSTGGSETFPSKELGKATERGRRFGSQLVLF